jgi:tetratricopeptide (TPR) repeat protein
MARCALCHRRSRVFARDKLEPIVRRVLPALLLATATLAQDVYVPPVPIGIKRDGKVRTAKSPIAFPDERATWLRVRSAHYDVLSNASADRTRGIVTGLETLASSLTKTSTRFRAAAVPTTVLVFADRKESEPYFELLLGQEKPSATGLYVRHAAGGTMFIDASRQTQHIEKTALHELVHDLLRQSERNAPHWIEEGLAEYFSHDEIRPHVKLVRNGLPMTLAQMFAVQAETPESLTPRFYAQSWAAVDWLMRTDRERFFPFLEDVERGTSVADALGAHYGRTLREMELGIRKAGTASHRIELTGVRTEVPEPSPLDRATLLFELGRFLSYVAGAGEEAQRHYAEALRVDPRHARTLAAVGRFEEAIAAGLDDPDVHLMYAETLLTTALGPFAGIFEPTEGDTEKFRKARKLAERALALGAYVGAHEGAALAALGTTYFVESDPTPGIELLARAHALLPKRNDVSLNLYAMLLRTQQLEKADALYAEVLANVHDKQLVFAVKNVRLVAETARANALAKAGKLDEAAAIVRALAAATEDPTGRRELEEQAASLESIGSVNRHIGMYNDAVALANTGKSRDAMKVLDELLKIVQDPQVARDAKKFRDELRRR